MTLDGPNAMFCPRPLELSILQATALNVLILLDPLLACKCTNLAVS